MYVKNIKLLFQLWEKLESMYLIVGFLAHQILSMIVCKLELKGFFLWEIFLLILRNVICNKII